jgi:hypothetical protein
MRSARRGGIVDHDRDDEDVVGFLCRQHREMRADFLVHAEHEEREELPLLRHAADRRAR